MSRDLILLFYKIIAVVNFIWLIYVFRVAHTHLVVRLNYPVHLFSLISLVKRSDKYVEAIIFIACMHLKWVLTLFSDIVFLNRVSLFIECM